MLQKSELEGGEKSQLQQRGAPLATTTSPLLGLPLLSPPVSFFGSQQHPPQPPSGWPGFVCALAVVVVENRRAAGGGDEDERQKEENNDEEEKDGDDLVLCCSVGPFVLILLLDSVTRPTTFLAVGTLWFLKHTWPNVLTMFLVPIIILSLFLCLACPLVFAK